MRRIAGQATLIVCKSASAMIVIASSVPPHKKDCPSQRRGSLFHAIRIYFQENWQAILEAN
jgi:hypothetical protein